MPAKIQIRSNLCWERPGSVRESWTMKARMDLFCDRPTSDRFAAFQNKRFQSRLRQIAGGDEPVVSSSDNRYVVHSLCRVSGLKSQVLKLQRQDAETPKNDRPLLLLPVSVSPRLLRLGVEVYSDLRLETWDLRLEPYRRFQSFNNCIAALRPGAPMMPPPGCVAEPHM